MLNTRILVCEQCYDKPQEQLRAIAVPADPTPIMNARTQDYIDAETDYQTISAPLVLDPVTGIPIPSTTTLSTQSGLNLTNQVIGVPNGLDPAAIMPWNNSTGSPVEYGEELNITSVVANGVDQISVTCRTPHGLSTDGQISVEGLSNNRANGFFSVIVTTSTAFTYQIYGSVPAGSLLNGPVTILTCLVGLPRGYQQIPLTPPGDLTFGGTVSITGTPIGLLLALTRTN